MTLNGVVFFISPNSLVLQAYYVTLVEDRPTGWPTRIGTIFVRLNFTKH